MTDTETRDFVTRFTAAWAARLAGGDSVTAAKPSGCENAAPLRRLRFGRRH